ncbi:hypothetical protein GCM10029992_55710 [Glycomyces albus]
MRIFRESSPAPSGTRKKCGSTRDLPARREIRTEHRTAPTLSPPEGRPGSRTCPAANAVRPSKPAMPPVVSSQSGRTVTHDGQAIRNSTLHSKRVQASRAALRRAPAPRLRRPATLELRDRLVTGYLPLAQHIAQRYSGKGIAKDDLIQVASIGLINAVDRFDPDRGANFLSYAVPTVMGEVRRHFRDASWPMRVPRRLQELRALINQAGAELAQRLDRPATDADLACHLGITESEVAEGNEAAQAYRAVSLDESPLANEERAPLAESLGEKTSPSNWSTTTNRWCRSCRDSLTASARSSDCATSAT